MIDDSALLHGRPYDSRRAHEYYLRTRKLKGRQKGIGDTAVSTLGGRSPGPSSKGKKPANAKLEEQKAALEARLDRLKDVLEKLVEAAKKRSGIDTKEKDDPEKSQSKDKADKKLTAKEKREAADRSKKYRKEHKDDKEPSAAKELHELQQQIQDIKKQIQDALEDARRKAQDKQLSKTASKGR